MLVDDMCPGGAGEFFSGLAEDEQVVSRIGKSLAYALRDVIDHAENTDDRGRQNSHLAGLVVEGDVAAGDRNPKLGARVLEATRGLLELPHDGRVLGRTEVEAIGDGEWKSAGNSHVPIGLDECKLCTRVWVEFREPTVAVGGDSDAEVRFVVDTDDARVLGLRENGVALDVAVVLVGDPRLVGLVRRGPNSYDRGAQFVARGRSRKTFGRIRLERVLPIRASVWALVDGAVVRDTARRHVDDPFAVPVDQETIAVGDFADNNSLDVPFRTDRHEGVYVRRFGDRHHAFLRFAHQDLFGRQARIAQWHGVEFDVHTAVAGAREFTRRARQSGTAKVLDARDHAGLEQFQGALDEQLLHEGVADLDARAFRGAARSIDASVKGFGREHGHAADAVAAGAGAIQNYLVTCAAGVSEMEVFVAEHADAKRVDKRVAQIGLVEDDLPADVGQAEAVAVAADASHDSGQQAFGVFGVEWSQAQRIHDGDGAGTHGKDVPDDAANAGGRALIGLDVAGMVVRLDLERDGVSLADVNDAGILADASECLAERGLLRKIAVLLQVNLGGLV